MGYNMRHKTIEFDVLEAFIPAFINGDKSGLKDYEVGELGDFMSTADAFARSQPGYRSHHWTTGGSAGFGRCDISYCSGDREQLHLIIMLD